MFKNKKVIILTTNINYKINCTNRNKLLTAINKKIICFKQTFYISKESYQKVKLKIMNIIHRYNY